MKLKNRFSINFSWVYSIELPQYYEVNFNPLQGRGVAVGTVWYTEKKVLALSTLFLLLQFHFLNEEPAYWKNGVVKKDCVLSVE
jgi:hypothetical protein